jgi:hypothetical protein
MSGKIFQPFFLMSGKIFSKRIEKKGKIVARKKICCKAPSVLAGKFCQTPPELKGASFAPDSCACSEPNGLKFISCFIGWTSCRLDFLIVPSQKLRLRNQVKIFVSLGLF